jgi:hypothetical protein
MSIPVTLLYGTHSGDPIAHRTGCADIARELYEHSEDKEFSSQVEIAAHVHSDMIDEDPDTTGEDYIASMTIKPSVTAVLPYSPDKN